MASILALIAFILSLFGSDLRTYWPGLTTHYLDGDNDGSWTVLWFEWQDAHTFRQYNSDPASPTATCHFDELSWWDDGFLRYVRTVDACGESVNEIRYEPPIIVTPRFGNWQYSGESAATYTIDGAVRCEGVNRYVGTRESMVVRTEQITTWAIGDVPGGCWAGTVTEWAEEYTFGILPVEGGGSYRAMVRSVGGNLNQMFSWDITFHRWAYLP